MSAPGPKKQSRWTSILGFICVMCAVACILFVRSPAIKAENVAARMQQFADYLSHDAALVGRQAGLSYGAITVEGVGYDKYVVIQDLHFSLSAKVGATDGSWALETKKATVVFDPLNDRRMIFKFADPITFTKNGQQKTVITMPTPLKFGYFENDKPDTSTDSMITLRFPQEMTLTAQSDNAKGNPPPRIISYDGMPTITFTHNAKTKERDANSEWRNIIVQSGSEQDVNMGAAAFNLNEKRVGDNKLEGLLAFTVSDFIRRVSGKAAATCSLTSNIGYSSTESLLGLLGLSDKAALTARLNKMVVACDDFTVKFDGDFSFQSGDAMPSGAVTVTIDDTKAFLASPLIPEQTRAELAAALPKITGQKLDELTKVSIPVKRDPNGVLMLGAVTSQEAGITVINQFFK